MEEKEEKVEDEDGESNWFGLEIPSLTRLNEAFVKLGIENNEKVPDSLSASPFAFRRKVLSALTDNNDNDPQLNDAARELIGKYSQARKQMKRQKKEFARQEKQAETEGERLIREAKSEEERRIREAEAMRERTKKPIVQCQVCKSTANYWAPCYVAPATSMIRRRTRSRSAPNCWSSRWYSAVGVRSKRWVGERFEIFQVRLERLSLRGNCGDGNEYVPYFLGFKRGEQAYRSKNSQSASAWR